jgi:hypothetical protein
MTVVSEHIRTAREAATAMAMDARALEDESVSGPLQNGAEAIEALADACQQLLELALDARSGGMPQDATALAARIAHQHPGPDPAYRDACRESAQRARESGAEEQA